MPDDHPLSLCQMAEARGGLYAIQEQLEGVKAQLGRLPTRSYLARTALGIIFATTMLTTLSILWFLHHAP
jgi:hypothetical protein